MTNKKSKPKVIAKEKNSILDLVQKLIGTRKKKTFWDWLTSK
tara:strand:+ start:296 stop:421 length:126 start_codon:yes stop_codon:yes gene_type:complete